ncbi:MAG TPA: hypothetical protein VKS78_13055 [Roseiarcus sp.]|nr:hypothetical protein [Roseiarcus sp.]
MKKSLIVLGSAALILAGAGAAWADGPFEIVVVRPSNANIGAGAFRINVSTGQVVNAWGGATSFDKNIEAGPLPPGDYHLYVTETLDQTGNWTLRRLDAKTGRTWFASGGGGQPFTWAEIAEPK